MLDALVRLMSVQATSSPRDPPLLHTAVPQPAACSYNVHFVFDTDHAAGPANPWIHNPKLQTLCG